MTITINSSLVLDSLSLTSVKFVKAHVSKHHSGGIYEVQVANSNSERSWILSRPFNSYLDFRNQLIDIVQHGHMCTADCPWIWAHLSNNFPRRHFFRYNSPTVIANRQEVLEIFFTDLLNFVIFNSVNSNSTCPVAKQKIPSRILYFFYDTAELARLEVLGGVNVKDSRDTLKRPRSNIRPTRQKKNLRSSSLNSPLADIGCFCCICKAKLIQGTLSFSPVCSLGYDEQFSLSKATEIPFMGLTTLKCGHVFHDECIIEMLNKELFCPQCKVRL